ncbi:cochaperone pam16 [Stylonychia lemnae]|uniref:Cochaperone pam16 n=1 Tax=Stylonychia lemnae TaxID=5949 RepID=A0A078AZ99_STYLE|nr:cochaperone pam16 [Stylonychia lemnae]|eukprot:CDW86138.1 cochaperone pam16 [Stylonychia lemnae]
MVNKFLINLVVEYGARIGKSVFKAYQQAVNSPGAQQSGFGKVAQETFGRFVVKPMTRSEAFQILSIEETTEVDPTKIMERFETLFVKNMPDRGGSFYLQSKIYFAKEHIMQDFPAEMNASKFNPDESEAAQETESNKDDAKKN